MIINILLCNIKHLLDSFSTGAEEEQVIGVTKTASIEVIDDTFTARDLEEIKEVVHIEIEENRRDHCTLADTVPDEKLFRKDSFPTNIGSLIPVYTYEQSDNNRRYTSIQ